MDLTAIAKALPGLIQTGFNVYQLVQHVKDNAQPAGAGEQYIKTTIDALPGMIEGGTDIAAAVTSLRNNVAKMEAENRGPNAAELAEQAARLKAGDDRLDAAAKRNAPGV